MVVILVMLQWMVVVMLMMMISVLPQRRVLGGQTARDVTPEVAATNQRHGAHAHRDFQGHTAKPVSILSHYHRRHREQFAYSQIMFARSYQLLLVYTHVMVVRLSVAVSRNSTHSRFVCIDTIYYILMLCLYQQQSASVKTSQQPDTVVSKPVSMLSRLYPNQSIILS